MAVNRCLKNLLTVKRYSTVPYCHSKLNNDISCRFYSQFLKGKTVKVACASGFWGDTAVAAPQIIYGAKVDYIVFDYLSEITMSLLIAAKRKSPDMGYAPDFVQISLAPFIKDIKKKGIKIVSNAGGVNPAACAAALQQVCDQADVKLNIAVIDGDDLMPKVAELEKLGITEMDSGMPFPKTVHSMNAYMGCGPIARALDCGADVVITGRCTDSSLVLGPLVHSFGWSMSQFDLLAAGSLAGHLIECGAQVTGGIFTDWHIVKDWDNIGFPIVEVGEDGHFVLTKPHHTGGLVSTATVSEQLLYEIGDPSHYFLPDVVCDFTNVSLNQVAENMVQVTGACGNPPSGEYKVSATYADGYRSTVVVPVGGPRASQKVKKSAEAIIKRCRRIFHQLHLDDFDAVYMEILGTESMYGRLSNIPQDVREVVLWLAAHHRQRKALEFFSREIAPAGTGMAPGMCNIVGGRPKVSPVLKLFSFLYPKNNLNIRISLNGQCVEEYVSPEVPIKEYTKQAYPPVPTEEGPTESLSSGSCSFRLEELAYTRSGDKGNNSNIGVIARDPSYLPYLRQALTAERVEEYFSHLFTDRKGPLCERIRRFDVPGIHGMNFLLYNALGGGGIASLRVDPQGKALGQMLLDFVIEGIPDIKSLATKTNV